MIHKKETCDHCQKEAEQEIMIEMGSLLDDSVFYRCETCFGDGAEAEGEIASPFAIPFQVTFNEEMPIAVKAITKASALEVTLARKDVSERLSQASTRHDQLHITV